MGRTRTEIDRVVFVNTIADAEAEQTFASRSALFTFVGEILSIPHYTVANRVREWGVELKTALGQRGRPAGAKLTLPKEEGPDFSDLIAAFAGVGLKSSSDLLTSAHKTPEQNEKIRDAFRALRQMVDCPRPGKVVNND